MFLSPVEYVIHKFGSAKGVADALGKTKPTISHWRRNGEIPGLDHRPLLELAKKLDLDITPNDLIYGRKVSGLKAKASKSKP